jgi:hypothetical protein
MASEPGKCQPRPGSTKPIMIDFPGQALPKARARRF